MIISDRFFDIKATLECGQVFRFREIENGFEAYSGNKKCLIYPLSNHKTQIISNDEDYFFNYFDLNRDYGAISEQLEKFDELRHLSAQCNRIHILRQDLFETIISFIISANNNIKRIKGIIERLCANYGKKMDGYYAFPTLARLVDCSIQDFFDLGTGYRATYIYETTKTLFSSDLLDRLKTLNYSDSIKALTSLKGIGRKVADCIALFALGHTNCYPVDANIFNSDSKSQNAPKKSGASINAIREYGMNRYGELAGFAQQWKFYHQIKLSNK